MTMIRRTKKRKIKRSWTWGGIIEQIIGTSLEILPTISSYSILMLEIRGIILGGTTKSFITTVAQLATELEAQLPQTLELIGLKRRLRFKEFLVILVTIVPPRILVVLRLSTLLKENLVSLTTAMVQIELPTSQETSKKFKKQSI